MTRPAPVVLKFGGTSVQDEAALRRLSAIVGGTAGPRVIVASALAGVTDALIEASRIGAPDVRRRALGPLRDRHLALAGSLAAGAWQQAALEHIDAMFAFAASFDAPGPLDPAARDALIAVGELASSRLVSAGLASAGIDATWVDARRAVVTDGRHGAARPDPDATTRAASAEILPHLARGRAAVVGGFVGATRGGTTTTLGRGGSDYTAGLVGASIGAGRVEIWTDVDGILSADPAVVPGAVLVERLTGLEAYDLARFGARVLHAGTLEPVARARIAVSVRNARRPASAGTEISHGRHDGGPAVTGIAHRPAVTLVDLVARDLGASGAFLDVVAACVDHGASHAVTPVIVSPQRALIAVDDPDAAARIGTLAHPVADVDSVERGGLVAIVGQRIQLEPAAWKAVVAVRDGSAVRRVVQSSSGCALVVVTPPGAAEHVVRELHGRLVEAGREMEVVS